MAWTVGSRTTPTTQQAIPAPPLGLHRRFEMLKATTTFFAPEHFSVKVLLISASLHRRHVDGQDIGGLAHSNLTRWLRYNNVERGRQRRLLEVAKNWPGFGDPLRTHSLSVDHLRERAYAFTDSRANYSDRSWHALPDSGIP